MISINLAKPKRTKNKKLLKEIKSRPCSACGASNCDPSHIRSVGSGGPDETFNVVPMCRWCHTKWHSMGAWNFCQVFPRFHSLLDSMGWRFDENLKLKHPQLERGI